MSDLYFERPYATVRWEADFNGVYAELHGFVPSEAYRETLEKALELLKAKGAHRWLIDISEQKVTSLEDQEWLATDFIPRCSAGGLKQHVLVVPKSVLAQMGLNRVDNIVSAIPVEYVPFGSLTEARQWLIDNK